MDMLNFVSSVELYFDLGLLSSKCQNYCFVAVWFLVELFVLHAVHIVLCFSQQMMKGFCTEVKVKSLQKCIIIVQWNCVDMRKVLKDFSPHLASSNR